VVGVGRDVVGPRLGVVDVEKLEQVPQPLVVVALGLLVGGTDERHERRRLAVVGGGLEVLQQRVAKAEERVGVGR
jgi:hypothetical protein